MRSLVLAIISILLITPALSAATVSGEIGMKNTKTITTPKTQTIKYYTGAKGGCYTLVKNSKTGKMNKKYVAKKLCKK